MSDDPTRDSGEENRSRTKDFWQLHVPLVLVLALCAVLTYVEGTRASQGVGRAWVYVFQWPIIAIFGFAIWNRYRKTGTVTKRITDRWRDRVAKYTAEAEALERAAAAKDQDPDDPELQAWQAHLAQLRKEDPPGTPGT